jgi:integrase/recombinase XerD
MADDGHRPRRKPKRTQSPLARITPLEAWPAADRAAWDAACRQAGPLDPPGEAVKWSGGTRQLAANAWGRLLTFLSLSGDLDPAATPAQRLTPACCAAFIESLLGRMNANTCQTTIIFLGHAATALAPNQDWRWVFKHPLRPKQREVHASLREKRVPDPVRLLTAAVDMCEAADADLPTSEQAERFRDGLLVAFAVSVAARRRNLVETRIGTHLILSDKAVRLHYPDTKTGEPFDIQLGDLLSGLLRRYLSIHRPVLLARSGSETDHLWIGQRGEAMRDANLYNRFGNTTELLVGQRYALHSTRSALATTIMQNDPCSLSIAAAALGHRTPRTTRRAYDQSGASASNGRWRDLTDRIRQEPVAGPPRGDKDPC